MWKYVSRRVKDTLERTYNVLDVGRTSFCSTSGVGGDSSCPDGVSEGRQNDCRLVLYKKRGGCLSWFKEDSGRFSGKDGEQTERERQEKERLNRQEVAQSWWSALTWVSGLPC